MKVSQIKKSMKPFRCSKCGKEIPAGSSYRYWQHMKSPITRWCMACGMPKASDLASSDKVQRYLKLTEDIESAAGAVQEASVDDVMDLIQGLVVVMDSSVGELRSLSDEYNTSADNMETVFTSGSSVIDGIRESADTCSTWADNLDVARQTLDSLTLEDYQCECDDDHEVKCDVCDGDGHVKCDAEGCNGRIDDSDLSQPICQTCHGTGTIQCDDCGGTGKIQCDDCDGTGVKLSELLEAVQEAVDEGMSETL